MNTKTKTFSMFLLGAILVAGTISMTIPSSFAIKFEDSFANDYKKHGSSVNIQKAKCNNISIIGTNIPSTSNGDMMNGITDEDDETGQQAQWSGNNPHGTSDFNRNVVTICNNVNNIVGVGDEEPQTGTLSVAKSVACTFEEGLAEACEEIQESITPDLFLIEVTGNNPNPSSFAGSSTPVEVTLGAGDYQVSEESDAIVDILLREIESKYQAEIIVIVAFDGDCNQNNGNAEGSIEVGQSQTCNIENIYEIK